MARLEIQQRLRARALTRSALVLLASLAACSSDDSDLGSRRLRPDVTGESSPDLIGAAGSVATGGGPAPELEAHALLAIDPAHGPFSGGQLAILQGYGFSSEVRVWFGEREVARDQILASRSDRVQVTVPPGTPGTVSVTTQNGGDASTRRSLSEAYRYDTFYLRPETGSTSGGDLVTLVGSGTAWDLGTLVAIDGVPCQVVAVRGDLATGQELDCRTGASTEGQKSVSVTTDGRTDTVDGGFVYEPGVALSGGFSGDAISGQIEVEVTASGVPLGGAHVIVGADFDLTELGQPGARIAQTDAQGRVTLSGDFTSPPDVTVAADCHQPVTFAAVPVDRLRVELDPILSPDCIDQNPPAFGGSPGQPAVIRGELIWAGAVEFQRAGWINVPAPAVDGERRAAYLFQPSGDPESGFRLPRDTAAVTLDSPGTAGYAFEVVTGAGNRTLYALAGIENRSVEPPRFSAYAMGLVRGLFAGPGETLEGIAIAMDLTLDQSLNLELSEPAAGARGPDRVQLRAAVQVSESGFALLPNARQDLPLPLGPTARMLGLPALVGALEGGRYVMSARAVSGPSAGLPQSILPLLAAVDASQPLRVEDFVPAPVLTLGRSESLAWNGVLEASWVESGRAVDLLHFEVRSGSGLVTWTIAAPPSARSLRLPDLSRLPSGDLIPGGLDVLVSLARLSDFDYSRLTTRQLRRFTWDAYAVDAGNARHDPLPR